MSVDKQCNKVKFRAIPHASSKISLLFVQFWAVRGFCQRVKNSRICQHCDVKTSTVTPTFYYLFVIFLTCYISVPSFIYNLSYVLLLGNHLKSKTKSISNLDTFSNFLKLNVQSIIFSKFPHEIEAAAICFAMERGRRKSQQNSRICVRAQIKLVYPV